jgi:benzoyl-CoA 2,3-dioxygenase component B
VANYYTAGLKGRWMEERRSDDHQLRDAIASIPFIEGDRLVEKEIPALTALNVDLRNEYISDCNNGVKRWNAILRDAGIDTELTLPHVGFNRAVGTFSSHRITPDGRVVDQATFDAGLRTAGSWTRPPSTPGTTCPPTTTRPTSSR